MTKIERECLAAARQAAASFVGVDIMWENCNGKHSTLTVRVNGASRKIAMAGTARTDNQPHWVAQDVRRLAKQLLALSGEPRH